MAETCADMVASLHRDLGLTLTEIAKETNLSPNTIRRAIKGGEGGSKVTEKTKNKIAQFFNSAMEERVKRADEKIERGWEATNLLRVGEEYSRDFISEYVGVGKSDKLWAKKIKTQLEKRGYLIKILGKQSNSRVLIEREPDTPIQRILDNAWGLFQFDGHRANAQILGWIIFFLVENFEDFNSSPMPVREEIIRRHAGMGSTATIRKWIKRFVDSGFVIHDTRSMDNWWITDWSGGIKERRLLNRDDPYDRSLISQFYNFIEQGKEAIAMEKGQFDYETGEYSDDFKWGYEQVRGIKKIFMDSHQYVIYRAPETKIIAWAEMVGEGRMGRLIHASLDMANSIIASQELDEDISSMLHRPNEETASYKDIVNNSFLREMVNKQKKETVKQCMLN